MRDLYAIKNHSQEQTFLVRPSEFDSRMPDEVRENKRRRSAWSKNPTTEHCFFTGFEGTDPHRRPHKINNPIARCLAIVADYDCKNQDLKAVAAQMLQQDPDGEGAPFLPYEICLTGSGGIRAVWYPETPMPMNGETAKLFMGQMERSLKLQSLVAGLDSKALADASKTYEVGRDWLKIRTEPLPSKFCWTAFFKATKNHRFGGALDEDFPLDRAEAVLRKKYPGYEFPKFEPMARIRRFWDPDALDDTGAVVLSGGVYCHSGDEPMPFIPWSDERLLGQAVMREFEEDRTGFVLENYWYDGDKYISLNKETGKWRLQSESSLKLTLSSRYGISPKIPKGAASSPREDVIERIQTLKEVNSAGTFVFMPEGPIEFNGEHYINTSQIKPMNPSGHHGEWGEYFPNIAKFLDGFFVEKKQKNLFLAWWKIFYTTSRDLKPVQGQAMFIAGPQSCGKTLLNFHLVKPSMGGGKDASQFYVEGNRYNEGFYSHGLHLVDDAEQGGRKWEQSKMASRYKRTVASPEITVEEKRGKRKQIKWLGRVLTTMNDDHDSLKTMPELQETLEDKVIILRAQVPGDFLTKECPKPVPVFRKELPHLLQWLIDWELPKTVLNRDNPRFIIKSMCDTKLKRDMREGSEEEMFADILQAYLIEYANTDEGQKTEYLDIPLPELRNALLHCGLFAQEVLRPYYVHTKRIPNLLVELNRRGYRLIKLPRTGQGARWRLFYDFYPELEEEEDDE